MEGTQELRASGSESPIHNCCNGQTSEPESTTCSWNTAHTQNTVATVIITWCLECWPGFPGGLVVTNPPASAGDTGSIPGSGRSPGGGNGNPLQHSCLGDPMDRRAWWAAVHEVTENGIQRSTHSAGLVPMSLLETTPGRWRGPGLPADGLALSPPLPTHRPPHLHLGNLCFPGGSDGKESACHAGDLGLIPGLGRSPGEGNGNPLQCSCLENSMNRGAWWATVHGVTKSWTRRSD